MFGFLHVLSPEVLNPLSISSVLYFPIIVRFWLAVFFPLSISGNRYNTYIMVISNNIQICKHSVSWGVLICATDWNPYRNIWNPKYLGSPADGAAALGAHLKNGRTCKDRWRACKTRRPYAYTGRVDWKDFLVNAPFCSPVWIKLSFLPFSLTPVTEYSLFAGKHVPLILSSFGGN